MITSLSFDTSPFDMIPKGTEPSHSLFESFGANPFDIVPKVKSLVISVIKRT